VRIFAVSKNTGKMKTISLKIDEDLYDGTVAMLASVNLSRNRYINEAILYYNKLQKKLQLEKVLEAESKACEQSSREVLNEFEMIDDYDF
jgi:hypothetical protein